MTGQTTGRPPCPRCGGELVRRLDDYECPGCGCFVPARKLQAAAEDVPPEPSRVAQRINEARATLPGSQGGRRSGLYALDVSKPSFFARWEKVLFLVVLFCETITMNLLTRHADPKLSIEPSFVKVIILSAFIVVALAALTLFIDWTGFKIFMTVVVVLLLAYYGVQFYMLYKTATSMLLAQMVLDVSVIGWFLFLLARDIIRTR